MPHSEIPGSTPICGSPRLIAACHVLHRLHMPRHPPCALTLLIDKLGSKSTRFEVELRVRTHAPFSTINDDCEHYFPDCQRTETHSKRAKSLENFVGNLPYSTSRYSSWWRITDSNRWPPACKAGALPTELIPHKFCACCSKTHGGPSWTRTNDLTLIRRAL